MGFIKAKVEVLSSEEILRIHEASLRILEKTGFRVPHDECLNRCERLGGVVDRKTQIVRVPIPVMESLLAKIRAEEEINAKKWLDEKMAKGEYENGEAKRDQLTGHISTQVFIVDYQTGKRRYGLTDDVMKGIKLVQNLNNIPFCNAVTIPSDVHPDMTDVVSHQLIYKYSEKPGGTYILTPNSAKWIIEMSRLLGRSTGYGLETVSPLQFRKESLDMAMVFADCGMGFWTGPMTMAAATSPVTLAGTVTVENAEILASFFLVKALNGSSVSYSSPDHTIDLHSMLCSFGAPAQALLGVAAGQMAKFYGLYGSSNSGLTDSLYPDFQAGFEKSINAVFSLLGGTAGIGCQGIVGADMGISLEQLIIDNEWMDSYNYVMNGFKADAEHIAEELIMELGIGGNYIAEEHTVEHMHDSLWKTDLFNRNAWNESLTGGGITLLEKAHRKVEALTAGYDKMEPVLDASTCEKLDYLVKCAKEELVQH